MLATKALWPFSDGDWWFEPKWDGIRGILTWDGEHLSIRTRTGLEVAARYPELARLSLGRPCVIDGEIAVISEGRASFERLQQRSSPTPAAVRDHPVSFVAFDLLHEGDESLVGRSLEERRARLDALRLDEPFLTVDPIDDGAALWELVREHDLEGMVAKRARSRYRAGVRSPDWRKMTHLHTVRAVVAGFTPGEGGRSGTFGALVLGLHHGDALRWIGSVGTGFAEPVLREVRSALDEQVRSDSPFHPDVEMPPATWVEPALVAVVEFGNWTRAGRLRHPRFKGFSDVPPDSVTWESEGPGAVER